MKPSSHYNYCFLYLQILEFGREEDNQTVKDVVQSEMQMIETKLDELEQRFEGGNMQGLLQTFNALVRELDRHKSLTPKARPRRSKRSIKHSA